jgi:hypothetical protein
MIADPHSTRYAIQLPNLRESVNEELKMTLKRTGVEYFQVLSGI